MTGEGRPKAERGQAGELKVYPARRRLGLASIGSALMTAVSLNALVNGERSTFIHSTTMIKVFGFVGTVLFGAITAALLVRSLARRPMVVLDADGILDRESIFRLPHVRWHEISDVAIEHEMGQRHLRFRLRDPESVAQRCRSPISRAVYLWGARNGRPMVTVSERHSGISLEELKKEAEAHLS